MTNIRAKWAPEPLLVYLVGLLAMAAAGPACSGEAESGGGPSGGRPNVVSPEGSHMGGAELIVLSSGRERSSGGQGQQVGSGDSDGTVSSGTPTSTSAASGSGGTASAAALGTTACNNGIDDDADGLIDGFDPECTGALDNEESSFATGIPGDNRDPKWQDCFFDGNSGAGDDGCRYGTGCLTGELSSTDADCLVTQSCLDFCTKLTPNGCDCFGCCTLQIPNGAAVDVLEVATCSLANAGDAEACPPCKKSTQCGNDCGPCELCAGKTLADLAPSCGSQTGAGGAGGTGATTASSGRGGSASIPPPPVNTCDNGEKVCGSNADCLPSEYCYQGCCLLISIPR